ncbi:ABC transporter ATP-binding protein [Allokutzneria oryzae]|uniref:ABC transporter ATP-binding protein n=1 Tax=Allokutzneria oryzae TaxID=1378989 RepID=A0ABV5ZS38_9PSEU
MLARVVRLIWSASPGLSCLLTAITVVRGLVPVAEIVIAASLMELLVSSLGGVAIGGQKLFWLLALLLAIEVVSAAVNQVAAATRELFETRVRNHITLLVAAKASELDLASFETPALYDEMRRAREASTRSVMIVQQLSAGVGLGVTAVSLAWVLVGWHWWALPVTAAAAVASLLVQGGVQRAAYELDRGQTSERRQADYLAGVLTDRANAKEVRLFGLGPLLVGRLRRRLDALYADQRLVVHGRTGRAVVLECVITLAQPALIGLAVLEVVNGSLTIAAWTLYTQAVRQLHDCTANAAQVAMHVYRGGLHAGDVLDFLARTPDVEARRPGPGIATEPVRECPLLELRGVGFTYPGAAKPTLRDVNLAVVPGRTTAVVGPNGAGKSTLVKIMAGLYRPTTGQVLFDGIDIALLDQQEVRARLSGIFQDFSVFELSAWDNIGFGDIAVLEDHEALLAASLSSGFHERVAKALPSGYETVLGCTFERGHELSGGQRQLLAITRALLRDSPILLLDEPSAALDIETERHFFQTVLGSRRTPDRATVFISHRMTTVHQADEVVLLEDGHVVERGTHDELSRRRGRYRNLYDLYCAPYLSSSEQVV